MRNIGKIILFLIVALMSSCEEDLKPYSYEQNTLGFEYDRNEKDSITHFTFAFSNSSVTEDTLWIDVRTTGYVVDYDRPIKFRQVDFQDENMLSAGDEKLMQAKEGIHYKAFNTPEISSLYYIPAGQNRALLPLIVKRDLSLKENKHYIKIVLEENEHFAESYVRNRAWIAELSDLLIQPITWDRSINYYFAGEYGPVKHKFMIDVSDDIIDAEYFKKLLDPLDMGYLQYLSGFYSQKLKEENARRIKAGMDLLREEPTEEGATGKLVQFVLYGQPLDVK